MATLTEQIDSREWATGENQSVTFHYILEGTSDDLTAKTLIENSTANDYDGLIRHECTLEPDFVDTTTSKGRWICTVRYRRPENMPPEVGQSLFSFDTGGGTQHITQSIQTVESYAASGTAPDFGGAIGVTHDNVEGVDITIPVYNFSETHYIDDANVTEAYRGALFNLTGKVNDGPFRGLATGECLFLGASGSKRGSGDWEISYRFAASPNKSGLVIGDIAGVTKKGWEYMWVRYADAEDQAAKAMVKRPVAVYIEKVYEEGDFGSLGIGA